MSNHPQGTQDTMVTAGSDRIATPDTAIAVEFRKLNKRFGAVHACKNIDLAIPGGEVHGLVGENGAGKSTLMSILYGFYTADSGEVLLNGAPVRIRSSRDAIDHGIGMVHQHFMLVDTFSVLENLVLGAEEGAVIAGSLSRARAELLRLEEEYDLKVDPDAIVGDLPVGRLQRVEILKALFRGAEILVLDEPTGVLTPQEADQLFRILDSLRERGVTVIIITHKLREIMAITDSVSVMRRGEIVAFRRTRDTNEEELAELMVGRAVNVTRNVATRTPGEVVLSLSAVTVRDEHDVARLDDVSLSLRAGELVGIAGVSGNGQSQLLEVLGGIQPVTSGSMTVLGHVFDAHNRADPALLRRIGLAHVPEDRLRLGLVRQFAASESAILGYHHDGAYCHGPLFDLPHIRNATGEMMEAFDVRPRDAGLRSANFSGGNQQKLILARELLRDPKVLIVGQPTRGVDIGAIEFIHQQLLAYRDRGCAILMVSVELEEVMSLADRILVMFEGRIVGEVAGAEADERTLGLMMANAWDGADGGHNGHTM